MIVRLFLVGLLVLALCGTAVALSVRGGGGTAPPPPASYLTWQTHGKIALQSGGSLLCLNAC